ncbi:TPA: hypothetical protein ROW14_002906 [Yersinia enterocolitica]|nr:hypothetical protein [Yersinia enterocolitica]
MFCASHTVSLPTNVPVLAPLTNVTLNVVDTSLLPASAAVPLKVPTWPLVIFNVAIPALLVVIDGACGFVE